MDKCKLNILSGNIIKIIAAIAMIIDHIGYLFFPKIKILRIIGRISFPLFAYMIAEGCKYTKNKLKYFINVSFLALLCQVVYFLFSGSNEMYSLVCFSFSIPLIYLMQYCKNICLDKDKKSLYKVLLIVLFVMCVTCIYFINKLIYIDYGFFGCMLPVITSALVFDKDSKIKQIINKLNNKYSQIIMFALGVLLLCIGDIDRQIFSLLSVLIVLFYSEKRGKHKMKYFFYILYPVHFVVLQAIYWLIF